MTEFPLFGKNSSLSYTANIFAGIGTFVVWLFFFIVVSLLPANEKPKFETVRIVLESTPIEEFEESDEIEEIEINQEDESQTAEETNNSPPIKPKTIESINVELVMAEDVSETKHNVPLDKNSDSIVPMTTSPQQTETVQKFEIPRKPEDLQNTNAKKSEEESSVTENYTKTPTDEIKQSAEEQLSVQIALEPMPIKEGGENEIDKESNPQIAKADSDSNPITPQNPDPAEPINAEATVTKASSETESDATSEKPLDSDVPVMESPQQIENPKNQLAETLQENETPPQTENLQNAIAKQTEGESSATENYTEASTENTKSVGLQTMEMNASRQKNSNYSKYNPRSQSDDEPRATKKTQSPKKTKENTTASKTQKNGQQKNDNKSARSGSEGTSVANGTSKSTATSDSKPPLKTEKNANNTASSEKNTTKTYSVKSSDGKSESITSIKSSRSSTGVVSVAMNGGSSRGLLDSSTLEIKISPAAVRLIDSTKTVRITFDVEPSGNVSNISFSPSKLLPTKVQDEIKKQISEWRFEAASVTSTAQFYYTILIR